MKSNQPIIGLILMGITLFAMAAVTSCTTPKQAVKPAKVEIIEDDTEEIQSVSGSIDKSVETIKLPTGIFILNVMGNDHKPHGFLTYSSEFVNRAKVMGKDSAVSVTGIRLRQLNLFTETQWDSLQNEMVEVGEMKMKLKDKFPLQAWLSLNKIRFYWLSNKEFVLDSYVEPKPKETERVVKYTESNDEEIETTQPIVKRAEPKPVPKKILPKPKPAKVWGPIAK